MAIQIYRKPNDPNVYEVGTNRIIGPTEFNSETANKNIAEPRPLTPAATPNASGIMRSGGGLAMYNTSGKFLDTAREIILRKQNMNKDLTDQEAYWRKVAGDTNAFGSPRDPAAQTPGMVAGPRDINYRELSPEDQSSLRTSRESAANAHLKTIATERKYRGDIMTDTLSQLKDILKEKEDAKTAKGKSALDIEEQIYDIAKKKAGLGLDLTADDFRMNPEEAIGTKLGGSDSWRHNNPALIKYDDSMKALGATKGAAAPDGGNYAIFKDEDKGYQAFLDGIKTKYKDQSISSVIADMFGDNIDRETYDRIVEGVAEPVSKMNLQDVKDMQTLLAKKYEWNEGRNLNEVAEGLNNFTDTQLNAAAQLLGKKIGELKKMTTDEINESISAFKNDIVNKAVSKLPADKLAAAGISNKDEVYAFVDAIASRLDKAKVIAKLKQHGVENAEVKYLEIETLLSKLSEMEEMQKKIDLVLEGL